MTPGNSFLSAKGAYSLIQRNVTKKSKSRFEMGSEQRYTLTFDTGAANKQLASMNSSVIKLAVKSMVWYANKTLRNVLDHLYVD